MRKLFARLARLEGSLVNVVILGESGVGKELIASALHQGSSLAAEPMVTLNCGALPRELVASELFGHNKGAFTGAYDDRAGAFERADGGTLFLDEIGELPLDVQPMLLRALESGEVTRVGGNHPKRVKVRVIAATNRDLSAEVAEGRFREDLYFRLAVVTLEVPPLRERAADIPLLASTFAAAEGLGALPDDVIAELATRPWPGNVRELKNAIRAFAALGEVPDPQRARAGGDLDGAIASMIDPSRPYAEQKDEVAARFTRIYLEKVLQRAGGNQTEAARIAGLDRGYLGRLLVKHGIKR
jgi:transcriptional regulator with GAF, ATPase, and Fis domain